MKEPAFGFLRGWVSLEVRGGDLEELINKCAEHGIGVWEVKPLPGRRMEVSVLLGDFFRLRPLLKQTSCRVHVKRRKGLPFTAMRVLRRKWFLAGIIFFVLAILFMSSMVWDVEVKGNVQIPAEDIRQAAKEEGLYPFQWKFKLPEQDKLSKSLTRKLDGTSWVGVTIHGTKATIEVVEATKPKEQKLSSPSNLISTSDAVITYIYAEKGYPQAAKNDRVKKGSILISGYQAGKAVVSKGEVRGLVWHEYNIEAPLVKKQSVLSGAKKTKGYLYFGNTAVQLTGYGKNRFEQSVTYTETDPLTWRKWKLPIGWMSEHVMEKADIEIEQTPEQAKAGGIDQAKRDILAKYGSDSVVKEQKILHENTENGKVYMKVLFEVEQNIAEEVPLVQDQGE
ncbi:sporulation protein YqfD [Paenibacillus pinistramenti]|uniref:sporulation protein YqfD n=1 Tax=Paenibacillus pinistramenti TaxID=1768003 RepID=UPI001107C116|nr:sporulation protein YqfD [Paenibacillus pinistramenti]